MHGTLRRETLPGAVWSALSFLAPIPLCLAVLFFRGQIPFGSDTLLIWDADWQYVSLFSHYHDILRGRASLLYSLSDSIGGNMYAVAAYYLFSPFSLLCALFPKDRMYLCFLALLLLKLGAASLAMFCFLREQGRGTARDGREASAEGISPAWAILLSLGYVGGAWTAAYFYNFMWLDALIALPVMILGIKRILRGKNGGVCILALSAAGILIADFYIAYMVCLFAALYFAVSFCVERVPDRPACLLRAGVGAVLGVGLAAFVLLPVFHALGLREETAGGGGAWSLRVIGDGALRYLFWGTIPPQPIEDGRPLLYAGLPALLGAVASVLPQRAGESLPSRRQGLARLRFPLLLGLLLLSLRVEALDLAWNGGHKPAGCAFRYSFLVAFLLARMAADPTLAPGRGGGKRLGAASLLVAAGLCAVRLLHPEAMGRGVFAVNLCLLLLWAALLTIQSRDLRSHLRTRNHNGIKDSCGSSVQVASERAEAAAPGAAVPSRTERLPARFRSLPRAPRLRRILPTVGLCLLTAELAAGALRLYGISDEYGGKEASVYQALIHRMERLTAGVDQSRGERLVYGYAGEGLQSGLTMLLGDYGASGYTSMESGVKAQIFGALGYEVGMNGYATAYHEGNARAADALLGIRYVVTSRAHEDMEVLEEEQDVRLYRSEYALPMAFLAEGDAVGASPESYGDYFSWMNAVYGAIAPGEDPIFVPLELLGMDQIAGEAEGGDGVWTARTDQTQFMLRFRSELDGAAAYLRYGFDRVSPIRIHAYLDGEENDTAEQVNAVKYLGRMGAEEELLVVVTLQAGQSFRSDLLGVCAEDTEALRRAALRAGTAVGTRLIAEDRLRVEVAEAGMGTEGRVLVTTLPREPGWRVTVDGADCAPVDAICHFLAIPLPPGAHRVELCYTPPGLAVGIEISLAFLLVLAAITRCPGIPGALSSWPGSLPGNRA